MPIPMKCQNCGHEWEYNGQKIEGYVLCPKCKKTSVKIPIQESEVKEKQPETLKEPEKPETIEPVFVTLQEIIERKNELSGKKVVFECYTEYRLDSDRGDTIRLHAKSDPNRPAMLKLWYKKEEPCPMYLGRFRFTGIVGKVTEPSIQIINYEYLEGGEIRYPHPKLNVVDVRDNPSDFVENSYNYRDCFLILEGITQRIVQQKDEKFMRICLALPNSDEIIQVISRKPCALSIGKRHTFYGTVEGDWTRTIVFDGKEKKIQVGMLCVKAVTLVGK